jgi:pyruvate-ferredoxin/flavodoxin oxidoreductase
MITVTNVLLGYTDVTVIVCFYGTTAPTVAVVAMGSTVKVLDGTLHHLKSKEACLIGVRMFRPWNTEMFAEAMPKSVAQLAVLDGTSEGGSQGEPLYLDVCTSLMHDGRTNVFVSGGPYGLGSKLHSW